MSTGDDIPPTISPTAVVTNAYFYQSIRDITGKDVPVWNWFPAGAYLPLYLFGPEKYGGLGDVANNAQHVAESTGRDVEEVTKEVGIHIGIGDRLTDEQLDDEPKAG